jgi:EmrB/QacA subfamily drug resistance transporter
MNQKVAVSVVYVAVMFMSVMDTSIVNVALPAIGHDFHTLPTAVAGVSIGFSVSLAVFMPASGWLGDRFGAKRVLMAAIAVFTIASALCGIATNLTELVVFRVVQGAGGGMLAPVGAALLFRTFPPAERVRASSIILIPTALAPALGPVVGGILVTEASWRWVFYVNVPIGVLAVIFGVVYLEHTVEAQPGRFDRTGFLLSALGLGLFMYGISEGPQLGWGTPRVLSCGIAGLALLGALVAVELRTAQPIIALRLLANRLFRPLTAVIMLASVAFLGVLYAVTLYFQDGRGLSALDAGFSQFPSAIGVMAGSQMASRVLYWRIGPRRHLMIGITGVAIFIAGLALMGAHTNLWWARLLLFGMGVSMSQVLVPAQAAAFATITRADTGRASTLYQTSRQTGAAIGVAMLTTAIVIVGPVHHIHGHTIAHLAAYHVCFLVAAGSALLAIIPAAHVHDADAAQTMVDPRARESTASPAPTPRSSNSGAKSVVTG